MTPRPADLRVAAEPPLMSFVPAKLLSTHYAAAAERPSAIELSAAVMFVDVSRYTELVEQYANRGQGELGKIPEILGRSYSRCIDEVYNSGGEVLWLAGDTLVAWWAGTKILRWLFGSVKLRREFVAVLVSIAHLPGVSRHCILG